MKSRRLRDRDMILHVDNGATVAAVAMGSCSLKLLLEKRLMLKDYYFIPGATRNLISISVLA